MSSEAPQEIFGRTIQIFLVDGAPDGLAIASIHGWTGSVLVATQSTFGRLLARPEVDRTGVYVLFGPDPSDVLSMRAYIGEADSVAERIGGSAGDRGFWEIAAVITTSDEALTKGHVRYLEARLLELANNAGRVTLDNTQFPDPERRRLPEADRANMESFLANLRIILPVVGLDLLKPRPRLTVPTPAETDTSGDKLAPSSGPLGEEQPRFEIRHRGATALAEEQNGEFIVLGGSNARKDTGSASHGYQELKKELIAKGILIPTDAGDMYKFATSYAFRSPSAAAAVVLDRSANGRTEWKIPGTGLTYHAWQVSRSKLIPALALEDL